MPPRRILSLWFPRLAAERVLRAEPELAGQPLAVIADAAGALLLASLDAAAEAAGLRRGMALGDARAICPDLVTRPGGRRTAPAPSSPRCGAGPGASRPGSPRRAARRWLLDVTGCAHLFGGEAALAARVEAEAAGFGLTPRARARRHPRRRLGGGALRRGRQPAGACRRRHRPGGARHPLARRQAQLGARRRRRRARRAGAAAASCRRARPSPVSARCRWRRSGSRRRGRALQALGLRRIADVAALPRAQLARRLGPGVARRLDQALGRAPEPVSPARPPQVFALRLTFPEPIGARGGRARRHRPAAAAALRPARRRRPRRPPGAADAGPHRRPAPSGARSASPAPPTGRRRSGRSWR